jgi:hypothetical protein
LGRLLPQLDVLATKLSVFSTKLQKDCATLSCYLH